MLFGDFLPAEGIIPPLAYFLVLATPPAAIPLRTIPFVPMGLKVPGRAGFGRIPAGVGFGRSIGLLLGTPGRGRLFVGRGIGLFLGRAPSRRPAIEPLPVRGLRELFGRLFVGFGFGIGRVLLLAFRRASVNRFRASGDKLFKAARLLAFFRSNCRRA